MIIAGIKKYILSITFPFVLGSMIANPNYATAVVCFAFIAGLLCEKYIESKEQYKEFAKELIELKEKVNVLLLNKSMKPDLGGKRIF